MRPERLKGKPHDNRPPSTPAVIPAAGKGTRFLPVTRAVPKELLPVGGKPMIQHAVEEAMAAGIETVCIVLHPEKQIIREYFVGPERRHEQGDDALDGLREIRRRMEIVFVTQEHPRGVADAVGRARSVTGDGPFALMLPDNVFFGAEPAIGRLLRHHDGRRDLTLLHALTRRNAPWFGNCGRTKIRPERGAPGLYRILKLQAKRRGFQRPPRGRAWVALARSVLGGSFFDYLERLKRERRGTGLELDDVPIFQWILRERGFYGVKLRGQAFDVGSPRGYAAANWFFRPLSDPRAGA